MACMQLRCRFGQMLICDWMSERNAVVPYCLVSHDGAAVPLNRSGAPMSSFLLSSYLFITRSK